MENKKILVCGHRSFVATGLVEKFSSNGLTFDCFSRGDEKREGCIVTGDVMKMADNRFLDEYQTIVNFIILKNCSVEDNLRYIASLLNFCKKKKVKHFVQISSISVYPNEADEVNEKSPIESDWRNKGGYASIKVAVDH